MKKFLVIGLIVLLSFSITVEESFATHVLSENATYYQGYNALSLTDFSLRLPVTGEYKDFSQKAQKKLIDLAAHYGDNKNIDYNFELKEPVEPLSIEKSNIKNDDQINDLSFEPHPDMRINANYNENEIEDQTRIKTNFNLNYQVNSKTMIRAGYGLSSQKGWNLNSDNLKTVSENTEDESESNNDNTQDNNDSNDNSDTNDETVSDINEENSKDNTTDEENRIESEEVKKEPLFENTMNQQSSLGISYKTSDNMTVSADYIHNNEFKGTEGNSTILGVEYTDEEGKLRAKYQINKSEEKKQTITGLELDLKELATINASYKLLDPQYIKNKLNKESVWDFGLDISLSEVSTFSIGYQVIDNEITDNQLDENFDNKESNINASFQIEF